MNQALAPQATRSPLTNPINLFGAAIGLLVGIVVVVFFLANPSTAGRNPGQQGPSDGPGAVLGEGTDENPLGPGASQSWALLQIARVQVVSGDTDDAIATVKRIGSREYREKWRL